MKQKNFCYLLLLIIAGYFVTRIINLTIIPIFTDEAIYIRWGQIGLADASHRFLSLEDGKQPLFIWAMYPMLKIFADPLVAGRSVSILAGFSSLIGIIWLAKIFFNRQTALFTGLLYVLSPFFLFYDRLAIYDSLTTSFAIWALLLEILLVTSLRLDMALLLGFVIGGGLLTKSSAQFFLFLLPLSLILFDWKSPKVKKRFYKWTLLSLIATVIAVSFSLVIKLSPLAHMVGQKNLTFILSFNDFIKDPFSRIVGNLRGLFNWLTGYLTWPMIIAAVASTWYLLKSNAKKTLLLLSWFILPLTALAAFAIVLYPRFILFMTFSLLIIISAGITKLLHSKPVWGKIITLGIVSLQIHTSLLLLFNPLQAKIPSADRLQFMDDWPSGYGINETVAFIKKEANKQPIFVATEGTFGLTPYALTIYLQGTKGLEIKGYWPITDGIQEVIARSKQTKTFVLFKDTQIPNPQWPLTLVAKYKKGRGDVYMSLYQVNP